MGNLKRLGLIAVSAAFLSIAAPFGASAESRTDTAPQDTTESQADTAPQDTTQSQADTAPQDTTDPEEDTAPEPPTLISDEEEPGPYYPSSPNVQRTPNTEHILLYDLVDPIMHTLPVDLSAESNPEISADGRFLVYLDN
jgi:hypothetical protein